MTVLGLRPAAFQIVNECFPNNSGQGIHRRMPCLTFQNLKPFAFPIYVIQRKLRDLMGAQSAGHQKKRDGMVRRPRIVLRSTISILRRTSSQVMERGTSSRRHTCESQPLRLDPGSESPHDDRTAAIRTNDCRDHGRDGEPFPAHVRQ